jgi:hypothetical protein
MSQPAKNIVPMELPKPSMGRQIEYEIYYRKGPKAHKEVEISVSMEDSIHWFCRNMTFRVLSVHPDPKRSPNAPLPLFYRPFPDEKPKFANHVNSGPARPGTEGNWYKPVFEFDDKEHTKLDPHIKTNP